jgi:hypothetical protein
MDEEVLNKVFGNLSFGETLKYAIVARSRFYHFVIHQGSAASVSKQFLTSSSFRISYLMESNQLSSDEKLVRTHTLFLI